jgi:hypothetical protein
MDKVLPVPTGRSLERPVAFPDVLLYRGRAGDGAEYLATFDRQTVVLARNIGGLACRIRVSVAQYQAVAVLAHDEGNTVRLMHREAGLSIDLVEFAELEAAEEYCDRLADFLDLPALTMAGIATSVKAEPKVSKLAERRATAKGRRARFLTRRKMGEVIAFPKVEGREIIARN